MPSEHALTIENESDLQAFLANGMRDAGWTVTREHTPDNTKERIDVLGRHSDIGMVGIEAKYVTGSGPNEAGAAVDQILTQYAGKTYAGDNIDIWGIALYGGGLLTTDTTDYIADSQAYQFACRRIVNQLGIGYVIVHRNLTFLDLGVSVPALRVPLFDVAGGQVQDRYVQPDMERVHDLVQTRFPE